MKAEKEESDGAYKQGSGSSDAMALGNEVHGLLELWIHKKMDLTGAGSQAKSIVEGFLASDLVDRVWGAKQRFAEMPFIMTPEQGEVAFGSIDLLMEEEGGWTVVDYKSNRVSTQQEAEEEALGYTLQGELYVKAVERALGISGVRCELWFVRGPFVVSMP
jgi:ATP-dependent helicase/nuclease subunit A